MAVPVGMGVRAFDRAGSTAVELAGGLASTYVEGVKLTGELGYEALKAGARAAERVGSTVGGAIRGFHAMSPQNLAHSLGRGIAGAARGVAESRGFLDRVGMAIAEAEGEEEVPM